MVLDSVRTLVIWVVSLALVWENFQALQLVGFVFLIVGMCLYNDIIIVPLIKHIQERRRNQGQAGGNEEEREGLIRGKSLSLSCCLFYYWVYWCFMSHQQYFSYICDGTDVQADWRRSCTYTQAPNAIDISQGSLTCPSKHQHGPTLFIRWFRHTAPFSCLLQHAGDMEDVFSTS